MLETREEEKNSDKVVDDVDVKHFFLLVSIQKLV